LDLIVISFVNENENSYHSTVPVEIVDGPYADFLQDRNNFITLHNQLNSFSGILYPIISSTALYTKAFLQHAIAALKGTSHSAIEVSQISQNPAFTQEEWDFLLDSLRAGNPYNIPLSDYGWVGQWDRTGNGNGDVITPEIFQEDINYLLQSSTSTASVTVMITSEVVKYEYVDGVPIKPTILDNSWTRSFSLKTEFRPYYSWTSFHSYLPSMYLSGINKLYSWSYMDKLNLYKHNIDNTYRTFYGELYPFVVELVSNSNPITNRTWEFIRLFTQALTYNAEFEDYVEERYTTFNKMIAYNNNQCSGELDLRVKDTEGVNSNYLIEQVQNTNQVTIDRNEKDWTVNELRDYRENYDTPIWNKSLLSRQDQYYIDKVLNTLSLNLNKNWHELESFRGKYLIIRLIFDKFVDTNLVCDYSSENEKASVR